jgi:hypothetical protein
MIQIYGHHECHIGYGSQMIEENLGFNAARKAARFSSSMNVALAKQGQPVPPSVSLGKLVSRGYISTNSVQAFEGMETRNLARSESCRTRLHSNVRPLTRWDRERSIGRRQRSAVFASGLCSAPQKNRPTRRRSESEPADSLRDKSNITGGWSRSLRRRWSALLARSCCCYGIGYTSDMSVKEQEDMNG